MPSGWKPRPSMYMRSNSPARKSGMAKVAVTISVPIADTIGKTTSSLSERSTAALALTSSQLLDSLRNIPPPYMNADDNATLFYRQAPPATIARSGHLTITMCYVASRPLVTRKCGGFQLLPGIGVRRGGRVLGKLYLPCLSPCHGRLEQIPHPRHRHDVLRLGRVTLDLLAQAVDKLFEELFVADAAVPPDVDRQALGRDGMP